MNKSTQTGSKPSLCFVALNAYNVLSGQDDITHTGGAEVQQFQMATWLAGQGYPVSFITLDHGQADGIQVNGIRIFKAYAADAGMRGLRFFYPRWSGLWAAMSRANADVYYHRCAESETGQVALWCRLHRRRFIFAAASDSDCSSPLYALDSRRERALYRLGLRLAHGVTAQTVTQQALLQRNMHISAAVVRNCGWKPNGSSASSHAEKRAGESLHVLWAGRFSRVKRLEWLLDVAQQCPEVTFEVVGAPGKDPAYASPLVERAGRMPNVRMHGYVPYAEMAKYYLHCHVLCCTSSYEGFPNTFLEAWSQGIPVVSTFDPDGAVVAHGLGWTADSVDGIVACLRRLVQSPEIRIQASGAALRYYRANHTPEACLPAFERLVLQVTGCEANPA